MRCEDCRFWSEHLAMAVGDSPIQAMCIVEGGPYSWKYTIGRQGCDKGKSNQYGAVDTPHEEAEIAALYAQDDAELEGANGQQR